MMLTPRQEALRYAETQLRHWQQQLQNADEPGKERAAQFWIDYYERDRTQQLQAAGRRQETSDART